jgi:hypothetical protein
MIMTRVSLLLLCVGVLAMGKAKTAAQEKKTEEPTEFKHGGFVFDERVTVKQWDKQQKKFLKPVDDVWANRTDTKEKGLLINVYGTTKPGADLTKQPGVFKVYPKVGAVIIDKAGNEYEVVETEASDPTGCWVKLVKAAPKKP